MLKSIIFLVKSFLGNFYRHLAIFSGHTALKARFDCFSERMKMLQIRSQVVKPVLQFIVLKYGTVLQCDQTTRLCFQYFAIFCNENLPKSRQIAPKWAENFSQNQINLKYIANDF